MKLALLFGPLCLSFRGSFDFDNLRSDPRGLTGSEVGFVRIAECLKAAGHEVTLFTESPQREWQGMRVRPLDELSWERSRFDVAIAINEPNLLRGATARLKVCEFWLNDVTFCQPGFEKHVDLFVSPSDGHLEQVLINPSWRIYGVSGQHPQGQGSYEPDESRWMVNPLGCDPERYTASRDKIPGRVIYCSSPDRGLHWLLQEWPAIKRAVPHATLRIFYRLKAWIDGFDRVAYSPAIEKLRQRALYIDETLRRLSGPEWGVEVCDSVSRERIEREMAQAECLAYPCDTVSWSEGFSCSILEACAAGAFPVITDCDALGGIYGGSCDVTKREPGWQARWRDRVIAHLQNPHGRVEKARLFASNLTWRSHVERLLAEVHTRFPGAQRIDTGLATIGVSP